MKLNQIISSILQRLSNLLLLMLFCLFHNGSLLCFLNKIFGRKSPLENKNIKMKENTVEVEVGVPLGFSLISESDT